MTATSTTSVGARPAPTTVVPSDAELDLATVPDLDRLLEQALATRPSRLCIDLSGCTFADGTACAALARWTAAASQQGAELELRGLSSRLRRIVALTGQTGLVLAADG